MPTPPGPVYGTSLTPPASATFGTSLPTSYGGVRRLVSPTTGHSQQAVNVNVIPRSWPGKANFVGELMPGMFLFSARVPGGDGKSASWVLGLRHVNEILQEYYEEASANFRRRKDAGGTILRGSSRAEEQGWLTTGEYDEIFRTTTSKWLQLPKVRDMISDRSNPERQRFSYLFQEGIEDLFSPLGYMQEPLPELHTRQMAVTVGGVATNVGNYWGNDLCQGHTMGFTLKRKMTGPRKHGAFAYHPWCGVDAPTPADVQYPTVTGTIGSGQIVVVGHFLHWKEYYHMEATHLLEQIGLQQPCSELIRRSPPEGCIVVFLRGRTDCRSPYLPS